MSAIHIHNLTVRYHRKPVLWSVDLEIPEGKIVGIVGPNGGGKSTLLKACAGIVASDSGYVEFKGTSLKKYQKKLAYLPQRESIDWDFPISVKELVLMGTYPNISFLSKPGKKEKAFAIDCLQKVGMGDFQNRHISELSGGQQQRIFLARALAQNPEILLLDEPFAAVDAATENSILSLIKELRDQGKTIVIVHHDLHTVLEHSDEVALLNVRLIAHGRPEEVLNSSNLSKAYGGQLQVFTSLLQELKR